MDDTELKKLVNSMLQEHNSRVLSTLEQQTQLVRRCLEMQGRKVEGLDRQVAKLEQKLADLAGPTLQ